MPWRQQKQFCTFHRRDYDGEHPDNRFDGVVHIFENQYNSHIGMWCGVLHLPTLDDRFARQFVYDVADGPLEITLSLEDGRSGYAEITETFFREDLIEVAFVGHSRLSTPRFFAQTLEQSDA